MTFDKKFFRQPKIAIPFLSAVTVGLLAHFPVMSSNLPNADAMSNFYFDQNMVTSGRWFLTVVCGISSYFDLKWVIGVLSILYLALSAILLTEFFEIKDKIAMGLVSALLVSFPAVAATFAYMYTADGYYLAFSFSVLAALLTKKYRKSGWALGALLLSLSMGTYQAYLAATILLCLFDLILLCMENRQVKEILFLGLRYLGMGVLGGILYFVVLKICLAAQGKVLDTYQGISSMGKMPLSEIPGRILEVYRDFGGFIRNGKVFYLNGFSFVSMVLLTVAFIGLAVVYMAYTKAYKKWVLWLLIFVFVMMLPLGTNVILLISSEAFYHLLMRMQWVLYPILAVVLTDRVLALYEERSREKKEEKKKRIHFVPTAALLAAAGSLFLIWQFVLADNIAYFNMNERYEKTYAYLLRIADRIEQTEGYYTGMPVMMIGVVDEAKYPKTDITGDVTERIYGATGDILVYKGEQYKAFMEHYLNVSLNVITDEDKIVEIYNSDAYREMDSFPAKDSIKIVDGVLYVKTEVPEWAVGE